MIKRVRKVAKAVGKNISILGDLPGPKMRIGDLEEEPLDLIPGDKICLTTDEFLGNKSKVSVSFARLPQVVNIKDTLFINDGIIHLEVEKVEKSNVYCRVIVGGVLRSRKGLNLPGIDLGISAFTEHDYSCLKFAKENNIDAVSQSFVETAADITSVRQAAYGMDYNPFIIAKIERSGARDNIDSILEVADGIMIARGDLGVEIPIEHIAITQKHLMDKARKAGKPVITATQMLESMVKSKRPTRAEATDVANAILDGTDCVMLSGESAMGEYPVEAVAMLSGIAAATEPHHRHYQLEETFTKGKGKNLGMVDLIALSVYHTMQKITADAVFVPTLSGATARNVTRYRLPVWVVAVTSEKLTCQSLAFSYGVFSMYEKKHPDNWRAYALNWFQTQRMEGWYAIITEGPSRENPEANNRMELIDLHR